MFIPKTALFILTMFAAVTFAQENGDQSTIDMTYVSSIRKELACYCGCSMTVQDCLGGMTCSESRALSQVVIQLVEAGKTRPQVMQAMVAKYGESILAAPTKTGFNLTAWILPFVALAFGAWFVGRMVSRWRRQTQTAPTPASSPAAKESDPYSDRFEEEFREFDS